MLPSVLFSSKDAPGSKWQLVESLTFEQMSFIFPQYSLNRLHRTSSPVVPENGCRKGEPWPLEFCAHGSSFGKVKCCRLFRPLVYDLQGRPPFQDRCSGQMASRLVSGMLCGIFFFFFNDVCVQLLLRVFFSFYIFLRVAYWVV